MSTGMHVDEVNTDASLVYRLLTTNFNDIELQGAADCIDLDLGVTLATNLITFVGCR
jgi:hypothetical protein